MPRTKMLDAVYQLEVIEATLHVIQHSEYCRAWSEDEQKLLAFEIGGAVNRILEAHKYERELYRLEARVGP